MDMKYKDFKIILDKNKLLIDRTHLLYKNNVDLMDYNDEFYEIIDVLMKKLFNKEQYDWIQWYMFENNFGIDREPAAWDKNNNPIAYSHRSLYKLIKELE